MSKRVLSLCELEEKDAVYIHVVSGKCSFASKSNDDLLMRPRGPPVMRLIFGGRYKRLVGICL